MVLIAIILGLLPSFAWLIFFLQEDTRPEPRQMILLAFLAGAAVTLIVVNFEVLYQDFIKALGIAADSLVSLAGLALIEEVFKFGAVYLTVRRSAAFDEPVDAMIYIIVAALGFAAVENIAAASGVLRETASVSDVFRTTTLRFIGATLLHSLASAAAGYYWALGILKRRVFSFAAFGILIATLLHTAFNYLIINFRPEFYPTIFLVVVALLIFVDFEKLKKDDTI
ncbi:MAG: PrsW family intramembrane metalloprotease [Parcubacteria group bacterium]|nr:PrsW family intramembrane metalloprotease [Parcubacteria group bacterium]